MNKQEAIDNLKQTLKMQKSALGGLPTNYQSKAKINEDISATELAISALEKQIPKKPLDIKMLFVPHSTLIKSIYGKCPICDTVQADDEYCQHCGQALEWRNEDE